MWKIDCDCINEARQRDVFAQGKRESMLFETQKLIGFNEERERSKSGGYLKSKTLNAYSIS